MGSSFPIALRMRIYPSANTIKKGLGFFETGLFTRELETLIVGRKNR
jgi:hypothetical protein